MNIREEDYVTISKTEYEELLADSFFLSCLVNAGVDNWQGYDYAQELYAVEHIETN